MTVAPIKIDSGSVGGDGRSGQTTHTGYSGEPGEYVMHVLADEA